MTERVLQYVAERSVEDLIHHLLLVLDRPEKLLLLREVRYGETDCYSLMQRLNQNPS